MAIDKMIPRFLVSDEDERLLKEGAMTDALNVSISEDGAGSEGVVKNMKGNTAATGSGAASDINIIGQVSDPQLGYIYFFAADADSSSNVKDSIYRYKTFDNTFEVVFEDKNDWLKFETNGFVKADVLNGDFQQNGSTQSILYFTDNVNPPRKINVDRAIAGDFNFYSTDQLDYALSAIKAPLTDCPSAWFETESTVQSNNLSDKAFQFCTQMVYRDGESSALSPISKLYFPSHYSAYGTSNSVFEASNQNVCLIDVKFKALPRTIEDVEKIRVIGRIGNDGRFFLIDEVDAGQNKTRFVFGASQTVYDSSNGIYRFFNDGVYPTVDLSTSSKAYDNVPLKARGQAIVGNRLMYSNYTEGFANSDPGATISVAYKNPLVESGEFSSTFVEYPSAPGDKSDGNIKLDFSNISWPGAGSNPVTEGTIVSIRIEYDPEGSVWSAVTPGMLKAEFTNITGQAEMIFGYKTGSGDASLPLQTDPVTVIFNYVVTSDMTVVQLTQAFKELISASNGEFEKRFEIAATDNFYVLPNTDGNFFTGDGGVSGAITNDGFFGADLASPGFTDTVGNQIQGNLTVNNLDVSLNYKFNDVIDDTSTSLHIRPYVANGRIESFNLTGNLQQLTSNNLIRQFTFSGYPGGGFAKTNSTYSIQSSLNFEITNVTTDDTGYIPSSESYTNVSNATSSFKQGSSHPLGVVYYDKFGRHGFVNEIGSAYVKSLHERTPSGGGTDNKGPAQIGVGFTNNAPTWADSFQLVYAGPSDIDSFTVMGVGVGSAVDPTYSSTSTRVYVSLKPLDLYEKERASARSYSFTEGDKLKVLFNTATVSSTDVLQYKNSNSGGAIEFNVVEVVTDPVAAGIIPSGSYSNTADAITGTWLALEAPVISSGGLTSVDADASGGFDNLRYAGYDYYSLSNNDYPNGDSYTQSNLWSYGTVVQIYSPKKSVDNVVYYEIGERRKLLPTGSYGASQQPASNHGTTLNTMNGSVWWRPITFTIPEEEGGTHPALTVWPEKSYYIESETPSDIKSSKDWSRGKAHAALETASEIKRFNGIIYSDAYAEDVANLSLSSFNPSLGNFESLESKFGAINYIGNFNDNLAAIQENRLSLVPVNKNIIQYAEGSGNVALSTEVLNQPRYASGDYGCGNHPESVLIQDNDIYFVDESRQAVMRMGGEQLFPISEKSMSSFFEGFFTNGHAKYVSGYDPRISTYFVTGYGGSGASYLPETVGYDVARGVWQSKYSFTPDAYANQNNMLYSAKWSSSNNVFWHHDSSAYNSFYSEDYDSFVEVVSKLSPSRVKVYNALSFEADSGDWAVASGAFDITTSSGQKGSTILSTDWKNHEESFYFEMPRDSSASSGNDSRNIRVGTLTYISGNTYQSNLRLSRLPIPLNQDVKIGYGLSDPTVQVVSVSGNKITFNLTADNDFTSDNEVDGQDITLTTNIANGDKLRGHFLTLKLTTANSSSKHELYCINTHVTDSKSHHPLGQQ